MTLSCKLTAPELQKRKATVLKSLRKKVIGKTELSRGFAFKFPDTDELLDELNEFIKTERLCCTFFSFQLDIKPDKNAIWLKLTGPEGAKEFIESELQL